MFENEIITKLMNDVSKIAGVGVRCLASIIENIIGKFESLDPA